jgi:hypothetical protein
VVDTKFLTKQDFPNLFDKEIYMPPEDLPERSMEHSELTAFLTHIKLEKYAAMLHKEGYDSIDALADANLTDLMALGLKAVGALRLRKTLDLRGPAAMPLAAASHPTPPEDLLERSRVLALAEMAEIDEGRHDKFRTARAKLAAHAFMSSGPGNSTAQPQPAASRPRPTPPEDLLERSRVLALAEMAEIDEGRHNKIRAARAKLADHAFMPTGPRNSTAQPQPARAAPSFQDSRLPNEWDIFHSRTDGKPYYRNRLTGDVTWDPPPPPGWEIHQSKTQGEAYYRNLLTGEVTWTRPTGPAMPLPSGWEAHQDRTTGKMFYRNLLSNKSQWERPYLVAPFERQSGSIVHPPTVHAYEQRRGKHSPMADEEISPTASEIAEFEMHMENLDLPSDYTPLPVPDNVMETQQLSELADLDKQEGEMRARTWAGGKSRIKSTNKKSLKKKRKSYRKSYKKSKSKRRTRKNTKRRNTIRKSRKKIY